MATHATADGDGGGDGRADTGHTDAADGADVTDSVRPALIKLTEDLRDERDRLLAGFASRRAVLEWAQRLTVRTMGRLPQQWYVDLADQFTGVYRDARQRTFLAALLSDTARDRDLDPEAAAEYRERLAGNLLRQAQHDAFRHLRVSANEYTDVDESAQTEASGLRLPVVGVVVPTPDVGGMLSASVSLPVPFVGPFEVPLLAAGGPLVAVVAAVAARRRGG